MNHLSQSRQTFQQWLASAGQPYHEVRYAGKPHECLAVCAQTLPREFYVGLFHLSDYLVSAVVSGPFVELQARP